VLNIKKELYNVKKLNKDYSSMDNMVEAYSCPCNCGRGCGTSATANYYSTNGSTNAPTV
jgi:putative bacteriocin precursor